MSAANVAKFIGIIAVHFPKPRFEEDGDERIWQASLTRVLGHFSEEVSARAADNIIRRRTRDTRTGAVRSSRSRASASTLAKRPSGSSPPKSATKTS